MDNLELELQRLALMHEEHKAWIAMCLALKRIGVVTDEDLEARVGASDTLGQVALNKIRDWGEKLVALKSD